jgi:hypothetical protein
MKNLFWVVCVVASLSFLSWNNPAYAGGEIKEVCHDKLDKAGKPVKNKDGSVKQDCKKIKVHKKLEGTKVPEKK